MLYKRTYKHYTHLKVQMNYVVSMETGHAHQNLPGQSDDVFLCESLVVISNTLVENFTSSSTERQKDSEITFSRVTRPNRLKLFFCAKKIHYD